MLDRPLYRNGFSTFEMRSIWSEEATIAHWIEIEQVMARCQADLGFISHEAARRIGNITPDQIDRRRLHEEMDLVGRPIVGLVRQMRALVGEDWANCVHFRSTTQDIMDTAMSVQMRDGMRAVIRVLDQIIGQLREHVEAHGEARMIGRTNGQYAIPMRLATRFGVWIGELGRRRQALEEAAARGLLVQIGGPVGDLSGYDSESGAALKKGVASEFGLGIADPHWQKRPRRGWRTSSPRSAHYALHCARSPTTSIFLLPLISAKWRKDTRKAEGHHHRWRTNATNAPPNSQKLSPGWDDSARNRSSRPGCTSTSGVVVYGSPNG